VITSLASDYLCRQLRGQLRALFPVNARGAADAELRRYVEVGLERYEHCASSIWRKSFRQGEEVVFDHLHTDQYAMFLYLVAHTAFSVGGNDRFAAQVYALNKSLHALDVFYEVELPGIFAFQHPVGTVLGRATYSDYLLVYQRCTVGSTLDGESPVIGRGVVLFGGSHVIGRCRIGNNVLVSAASLLLNASVPDNSLVFGQVPALTVRPTTRNVIADVFGKPQA
jgi:serine O-acetyltransferase